MTVRPIPSFSRKRVDEDVPLSYDFVNDLPSGVSIGAVGTTTATVAADSAVSDASPSSIISGSAADSGTVVTQKIVDGTNGCKYLLVFQVTGDDSMIYQGEAYLLVENAT